MSEGYKVQRGEPRWSKGCFLSAGMTVRRDSTRDAVRRSNLLKPSPRCPSNLRLSMARRVLSTSLGIRQIGFVAVVAVVLLSSCSVGPVLGQGQVEQDVSIVALTPPEVVDGGDFSLAPALKSVLALAVERVNEDRSFLADNVSLSSITSTSTAAAAAAADLCTVIESNDTTNVIAVSTLGTSSAALIGSLSNGYLHLPILSVGGTAATPDLRDSTSGDGGFLLNVQPGIDPQMQALVRLILDMKLARDALDGRSETTERVWLVHTSDAYGTNSAAAFNKATGSISVPLPVGEEDDDDDDDDDASTTIDRATVEIISTTVLTVSAEASLEEEMTTLADEDASIIVLLAEGFDGAVVRTALTQARNAGLTEQTQWYLPDAAAFDHIFALNSTYRDAELAYDMRGTLGVRSCTPRTGAGSTMADDLTQEWQRLDSDEYPGAGPESLTADGIIDPLLAYAYDAIFVAAAAVPLAREDIVGNLTGIELDRCPFPSDGPWELGATVRDSVFLASKTLTGATGPLSMSVGEDHDGRDVDTVTFCAVNLRPHTTWGARFETIGALDGGTLEANTADGFQAISPFQEDQTFPGGSSSYPDDRPLLLGRHLDIVTRYDAPPFVFIDGDGDDVADFSGITPSLIASLSDSLGFTYTLRAPPPGTSTSDTIEMVRNGSADMTGSWITITAERSEYVSFTYPYYDLGIAFVYKPTIEEQVDLWKAFSPFEPGLWLALLFALTATVFLLYLYEGAKNDQFAHGNWGKRHRTASRGLSRSVYVTLSLMMSQLTHKPETLEGYLLTLGWLFSSFVLAASYTAELASFLTASKLASTDFTIEGLRNGEIPHSSVALLQGGNTQMVYERDFMFCDLVDDCSVGAQPLPCFSSNECLEMVMNGTTLTALADSATADYQLQNDFCGLATLPEILYPQHYGLVLPFESALREDFQTATLQLREDGSLTSLATVYLESNTACASAIEEDEDTSNMTVADVSGVFVVLGIFVALSMCSWIFRRSPVAKGVRARRQRARGPSPEESVTQSFSKMSRRQQKSFALEATVRLLQESKSNALSSSTWMDAISEGPIAEHERRKDLAEGRPVVDLTGASHSRRNLGWGRSRSGGRLNTVFRRTAGKTSAGQSRSRNSPDSRNARRPGFIQDDQVGPMVGLSGSGRWSSHGSDASSSVNDSPGRGGRQHQQRKNKAGLFGMFGGRGPPPADHASDEIAASSGAARSAASKWLNHRNPASVVSPVGARSASTAVTAPNVFTRDEGGAGAAMAESNDGGVMPIATATESIDGAAGDAGGSSPRTPAPGVATGEGDRVVATAGRNSPARLDALVMD